MPSGYRPAIAMVVAHRDDRVRRSLIDAVAAPGARIVVVGIAAETAAAHALVRRSAPDVALIELDLPWAAGPPGGGGVDVATALRRELPTCAVVLHGDDERARSAAPADASGWVDAAVGPDDLVRTIRAVGRRERVAHASWVRAALEQDDQDRSRLVPLDRRILEALADGADVPTVGAALHLTGHEVGRRAYDALARVQAAGRG